MVNGLFVSKPGKAKKEPEIIDLQEHTRSGKAASVQSINKLRMIHDFIMSNGRF